MPGPDNAVISNMSMEERIRLLEHKVEYQEFLHRNVESDGNIYHRWNILPVLIVATVIGVSVGYYIFKNAPKRPADAK